MTIGHRIKQIRGKISREEFAQSIGIHAQTLYRYETGSRGIDSEIIATICEVYDISTDWIIFGDRSDKKNTPQPQTLSTSEPQKGCEKCLELFTRLDQVNERLYAAMKENGELKETIGKLREEIVVLKNAPFTDQADTAIANAS